MNILGDLWDSEADFYHKKALKECFEKSQVDLKVSDIWT